MILETKFKILLIDLWCSFPCFGMISKYNVLIRLFSVSSPVFPILNISELFFPNQVAPGP